MVSKALFNSFNCITLLQKNYNMLQDQIKPWEKFNLLRLIDWRFQLFKDLTLTSI